MIFLILSILSSTAIFIIFKYLDKLSIPTFPVIVYNYLFAFITGFIVTGEIPEPGKIINSSWLVVAVFIGIMFIIMFYVIGRSSQKAGIAVTTVASKMSVMIPISFSIIFDPGDDFNLVKLTGIILALTAVFLTIYKKRTLAPDRSAVLLPFLLFAGMGMVDSMVKYAQLNYVNDREASSFTSILFLISFLTGIFSLLVRRKKLMTLRNLKVTFWGLLLGLVNFGSIYFLLRTLNYGHNGSRIDSSVVFGVNNTGIVMLSVLAGMFVFRERLAIINRVGIVLSIVAIIIFSMA